MSTRALISGITAEDGSYRAGLPLEQGYDVTGIVRRASAPNFWRIEYHLDRSGGRDFRAGGPRLAAVRAGGPRLPEAGRSGSPDWRSHDGADRARLAPERGLQGLIEMMVDADVERLSGRVH